MWRANVLKVSGLRAGYGGLEVLHEISFFVCAGEVVALLGANGAGKTTALRAISGLVAARSGSVEFGGRRLTGLSPHRIARAGIGHVAEGRELFAGLTVRENLEMGGYHLSAADRKLARDRVLRLFPILGERMEAAAGSLSGGQQQMVAIGRALMGRPTLLMLDEPSLGLDPLTTGRVFAALNTLREEGLGILLVEQNAVRTLRMADRAYVLENGQIQLEALAADLLGDKRVRTAYLGL